jgi:hypothetical protein
MVATRVLGGSGERITVFDGNLRAWKWWHEMDLYPSMIKYELYLGDSFVLYIIYKKRYQVTKVEHAPLLKGLRYGNWGNNTDLVASTRVCHRGAPSFVCCIIYI